VLSWLSAAAAAWMLYRLLDQLSHGSRADSRMVFTGLGLVLAPVFVRAGLTVMSDAMGLALALAAFFYGLRWVEQERGRDAVFAAVFMALAMTVRIGLAGLMLPLALVVGWYLLERRKWGWMAAALLSGLAILLPQIWLGNDVLTQPMQHSMFQKWSLANFFSRSFLNENGLVQYRLPNILYLGFPLLHPGFCILLPGLLLLAKKTDVALPAKKALLLCLGAYLLLLGGLPHQNLRFLLPAYALLLLLFFPAWDRLYCYGLYFFKRLTWSIIALTLVLQLALSTWQLWPTLKRNQLECSISKELRTILPANAVVYSFDLDIALQSYLPEVKFVNLWYQRYDHFQAGSYVLFNESALRAQWEGQNPMLNWDFLQENYKLEIMKELPEGWKVFLVN
jgi:hypothetical protein